MFTASRLTRFTRLPGRRAVMARSINRAAKSQELKTDDDLEAFVNATSWSVASLLPTEADLAVKEVSPAQLRHLLRLSALPAPASPDEEAAMLRDLHAQLHFVRAVQGVDAEGVAPLVSLRDETAAGLEEATITLESLRDALAAEETVGVHHKRIRRQRVDDAEARAAEDWDVLGQAKHRVGRYFVVESGEREG